MTFYFSQILVGIAFATDLFSFQFKDRRRILLCFLISLELFSLHFVLLEQFSGASLMLLSACRIFASLKLESFDGRSLRVMLLFLFLSLVACIITWQGPRSLIAFAGSVLATLSSFQSHDRPLRLLMMGSTSFWITYDVLVMSPMAVVADGVFLGSNLLGYWRYYGENHPILRRCNLVLSTHVGRYLGANALRFRRKTESSRWKGH